MMVSILGSNGERIDPVSGITHLGNGYRAYNPVLMRFNCPDSMSPFGAGSINPYVYCAGDPVNRTDPSGHFSLGQWMGMGVGLLAGIALSIVTEGAAMPVVLSLMATAAGDAFIGAGSEVVTEAIDGQRINWSQVGIAAGLSAAATVAGYGLKAVYQKIGGISQLSEDLIHLSDEKNMALINSSRMIRIRNGSRVRSANFMFDDTYKAGSRLNIVTHGHLNQTSGIVEVRTISPGRSFSGHAFASFLRDEMEIVFDEYDYVRILMCNSAGGGINGFASQFAQEIGIRVKAFSGRVTIKNPMQDIADKMIYQDSGKILSESGANTELVNRKNQGRYLIAVLKHGERNTTYNPEYFDEAGKPVNNFKT